MLRLAAAEPHSSMNVRGVRREAGMFLTGMAALEYDCCVTTFQVDAAVSQALTKDARHL